MENAKRGFVFYFDNYFVVEDLPPDQRGWLLSALCVYAERVWRDPSVTMEEILDHYPQMSGQTRIACGFLGAAVLRDTQRWLSQRQARALRRQQGDRPGRPPAPARERSWSREQDMELTRKLAACGRRRPWRRQGEQRDRTDRTAWARPCGLLSRAVKVNWLPPAWVLSLAAAMARRQVPALPTPVL